MVWEYGLCGPWSRVSGRSCDPWTGGSSGQVIHGPGEVRSKVNLPSETRMEVRGFYCLVIFMGDFLALESI